MSVLIEKVAFIPSSLVLKRGDRASQVRALIAMGVLTWMGLLPNESSMWRPLLHDREALIWICLPVAFDLIYLLAKYIEWRRRPKFSFFTGPKASFFTLPIHKYGSSRDFPFTWAETLVFCLNLPLFFWWAMVMMDAVMNLFRMNFIRETCAIIAAVILQVVLFARARGISARYYPEVQGRPRTDRKSKILEGLAATVGLYVYGFTAFFLFHLTAASFLSDEATENIEEMASAVKEWIEHPFGLVHRGIKMWLIFTLLFAIATFIARPGVSSGLKNLKKFESSAEAFLIGFLLFSLLTSETEQMGFSRESRLAEESNGRLQVVQALQTEAAKLTVQDKSYMHQVLLQIEQGKEGLRDKIALASVSSIEKPQTGDISVAKGYERSKTEDPSITLLAPPGTTGQPQLRKARMKREATEAQIESAIDSLKEVLSGTSEGVLGKLFPAKDDTTKILTQAISDFISENSLEPVTKPLVTRVAAPASIPLGEASHGWRARS